MGTPPKELGTISRSVFREVLKALNWVTERLSDATLNTARRDEARALRNIEDARNTLRIVIFALTLALRSQPDDRPNHSLKSAEDMLLTAREQREGVTP